MQPEKINGCPEGTVAVAYYKDGTVYDFALNWETAQCLANEGYRLEAVSDDGAMSQEEIQQLCDYEQRIAINCFGEGHRK